MSGKRGEGRGWEDRHRHRQTDREEDLEGGEGIKSLFFSKSQFH